MTPFRKFAATLITLSILYSLYRGDDLAVVLSLAILPMCFMTGRLR